MTWRYLPITAVVVFSPRLLWPNLTWVHVQGHRSATPQLSRQYRARKKKLPPVNDIACNIMRQVQTSSTAPLGGGTSIESLLKLSDAVVARAAIIENSRGGCAVRAPVSSIYMQKVEIV